MPTLRGVHHPAGRASRDLARESLLPEAREGWLRTAQRTAGGAVTVSPLWTRFAGVPDGEMPKAYDRSRGIGPCVYATSTGMITPAPAACQKL